MFVTNWISPTKIQKISEITNFFRHYFLSRTEVAIFNEKNKEFIQEGQRWWDLCRMTLTKGGKHLVFCKEASLDGINPVLNESVAYKVLWPLDKTILSNDSTLVQTPGY